MGYFGRAIPTKPRGYWVTGATKSKGKGEDGSGSKPKVKTNKTAKTGRRSR